MKKLILLLSLVTSFAHAQGNVKISDLPLGTGAGVGLNDSFPYVDANTITTKRLKLVDLTNVPAFQNTFAKLVNPVFTTSVGIKDLTTTNVFKWQVPSTLVNWGLTVPAGPPPSDGNTYVLSVSPAGLGSWVMPGGSLAIGQPITGGTAFSLLAVSATGNLRQILPGTAGYVYISGGGGSIGTWVDPSTFSSSITVSDTASLDLDYTAGVLSGTVPVMIGDSGAGGVAGLVPAPGIGDATKVLKGNGTWGAAASPLVFADTDSIDSTDTAGTITNDLRLSGTAASGGNIAASSSIDSGGLRVQVPILVGDAGSGGVAGVAPAPGIGDAVKFLRGDGTYASASSPLIFNNTNSVNLTNTAGTITADLKLSAAAADAGFVNAATSIETDGLQVQVPLSILAPTITNFSADNPTIGDQYEQILRHTGTAPLTLTTLNASSLPNGGRLTIMALSNDFPVTIPQTLVGVQNGDAVLGVGGTISYIKDSTLGLVEVSRNGL